MPLPPSRRRFLTHTAGGLVWGSGLVGLAASCSPKGGTTSAPSTTPEPVTAKPDVRPTQGPRTLLVLGGTPILP